MRAVDTSEWGPQGKPDGWRMSDDHPAKERREQDTPLSQRFSFIELPLLRLRTPKNEINSFFEPNSRGSKKLAWESATMDDDIEKKSDPEHQVSHATQAVWLAYF
jgi:hypothetical protein